MYLEGRLTLLEFEINKAELFSFHFLLTAKAPFKLLLLLFFQEIQWWQVWRVTVLCLLLDILFIGICEPSAMWRNWRACMDNLFHSMGMVTDPSFLVVLLLLPATQNTKDLCNVSLRLSLFWRVLTYLAHFPWKPCQACNYCCSASLKVCLSYILFEIVEGRNCTR